MDALRVGFNFKYDMPFHPQLSLTGNAFTTIAGRNVGKSTGFNAGIFYVIDMTFKKNKKESATSNQSPSN